MASEPPAARRVAFAPTNGSTESELTEAAMILPEILAGKPLLVGEEVEAGAVKLLVTQTTPAGRVRVDAGATELALAPKAHSADPDARRHVFDLLVLVDVSWSMGKMRDDRPAPARRPIGLVRPALDPFVRQAGDLVRHAALATFSSDLVLEHAFAPLAALDLSPVSGARPRGRTALAPAVDVALGVLAEGADARNRQAILLFTDDSQDDARLADSAARAARMGVNVHVVDVGDAPSAHLRNLARATRGVYAFMPDGVTLEPVFRTLAAELEAPFEWLEPAEPGAGDGDVEFEVVLRQIPEDRQ